MRAERRPERVSSQTTASPGTTCGVGGLALDICSSDLRGLGVGEAGDRGAEKCLLRTCSEVWPEPSPGAAEMQPGRATQKRHAPRTLLR